MLALSSKAVSNKYIAVIICILFVAFPDLSAEEISFKDLLKVQAIDEVQISPNGQYIAYTLSEVDFEKNIYVQTIWFISVTGLNRRKIGVGSGPSWSPDSQRIAYVATDTTHKRLLHVGIFENEPEEIYRTEGHIFQIAWSPDGHRLAFLSSQTGHEETFPIVIDNNDLERLRLYVVDLKAGMIKAVSPLSSSVSGYDRRFFIDGFSWSPDGESLVFGARPSANRPGDYRYSDLMIVKADSTDLNYLVQREGMDGNPKFSPSGDYVAFIQAPMDWVRFSNLELVSVDSRRTESLTQDLTDYLRDFSWSENGSQIFYTAGKGVYRNIYSFDIKSRTITQLNKVKGVYSKLSVSNNGDHAAFVFQDSSTPPQIYYSALGNFEQRKLTNISPQLYSWKRGETVIVRWKNNNNMEIEGLVHLPIGYQRDKQYPLIVYPHGGPQIADVNKFLPADRAKPFVYAMTTRGYAVFQPNYRGSGHYGEEFLRRSVDDFIRGPFYDVMSGVDYLIKKGIADPNRLTMIGHSYGAYMTAWAVTQTNRFKAVVAGSGLSNLFSMRGTSDVPSKLISYMGNDTSKLLENSPITYADSIGTPTFIWHGQHDQRVQVSQSYELYTALKRKSVPILFVIYPGQGHFLTRPSFQLDLLTRKLSWLNQWMSDSY